MTEVAQEKRITAYILWQHNLPKWLVKLDHTDHTCDFALYRVRDENGLGMDEVPLFLPKGHTSTRDARPWDYNSAPILEGWLKWDGCVEFSMPRHHFCDVAVDFDYLHEATQALLRLAHAGLKDRREWSPLPNKLYYTPSPFILPEPPATLAPPPPEEAPQATAELEPHL